MSRAIKSAANVVVLSARLYRELAVSAFSLVAGTR
jgi:hypothetical protein